MAGWNIFADQRWGSVTSPTTSPGACSKREGSDPDYTPKCEESDWLLLGADA